MKLWSDFYDLAVPELPGCPQPMIDIALREAAIQFCEMSLAWRVTLPDVAVVAGTNIYAYVPPAGSVVHAITYAEFNGTEIATDTDAATVMACIYDWRNQSGTPRFVLGGAETLTLVPNPDADGTLTLTVALKPAPDATGVDDFIFNEWRTGIVDGALARLMAIPKKPYYDPEGSTFHQIQFVVKSGQACNRVARSYNRTPLQTTILSRGRRGT